MERCVALAPQVNFNELFFYIIITLYTRAFFSRSTCLFYSGNCKPNVGKARRGLIVQSLPMKTHYFSQRELYDTRFQKRRRLIRMTIGWESVMMGCKVLQVDLLLFIFTNVYYNKLSLPVYLSTTVYSGTMCRTKWKDAFLLGRL